MRILVTFKHIPISIRSRKQFAKFIRNVIIRGFLALMHENKDYLLPKFTALGVDYKEVYTALPQLVDVNVFTYGLIVGYSPNISIRDKKLKNIIQSIDYGSPVTGLPKPIFSPVIQNIEKDIQKYYKRFIGLR